METQWTSNIGEQARQIRVHDNKYTEQTDILVLGESSFFILTELSGEIRFQKRYAFSPTCFKSYHLDGIGRDLYVAPGEHLDDIITQARMKRFDQGGLKSPGFMTLLGSFEGYLLIYKDTKLAWTTKMATQPIFVDRANFKTKKGLIVTFTDDGQLAVSFLGTDQMSQTDLGKLHQSDKQVDY